MNDNTISIDTPSEGEEYNAADHLLREMESGEIKILKREDFPHLVELEADINKIPFGTMEYWKQRCINLEKSLDPTYSDFERSNCFHFYRLLVNKK